MTIIGFVADAEVVNGTAGTSVVVPRPANVGGTVLVAFVAAVGTPTITAPAGWALIGTQDASTSVRIAAYYKVAASEPASWTWTLGAAQRTWGWVGAYSGVDINAPIFDTSSETEAADTTFSGAAVTLHRQAGRLVAAVAGVRTATGTATTWTASGAASERADMSTTAGAGTDIGGCVSDRLSGDPYDTSVTVFFSASQTQDQMSVFGVSLRPAFTEYSGEVFKPRVRAAFGFDSTSDPSTWVWTDITARVRGDVGVTVEKGAPPESTQSNPASIRLSLRDRRGDFIPDNPLSIYYPNIEPGVPIEVSVPYGYADPNQRIVAFAESWEPSWDESADCPAVDVKAFGRLHELQQNNTPIRSALYRKLTRPSPFTDTPPYAHWSFEDAAGAQRIASSMPYINPLQIVGAVNLAEATDLPASLPLAVMTSTGAVVGSVAPTQRGVSLTPTGQWAWLVVVKTPSTPVAAATNLITVECTGTARYWGIDVVPGSPDTFNIRAYDFDRALILDDAVTVDESTFYGSWMLLALGVAQNGANVDYEGWFHFPQTGTGNSGTLLGRTIGQASRVRVPGVEGMGVGHLTLYTAASYDISNDPSFTASALGGHDGESPVSRLVRLAGEEGIPIDSVPLQYTVDPTIAMGPQGVASLGTLLKQAADTEQGQLHDGGTDGGLMFIRRQAKYNAEPALIADVARGQVAPGLAPKRDTAGRITDSTVTREGGSSARYAIDAKAPRAEQVTVSLETDEHLKSIAAWRVALGSVEGMRYPQLKLNLRKAPVLTRQWLDCSIGSRVQVVNAPHKPDTLDLFIDGYTEVISGDRWEVTLNCSPAGPWVIGVVEDPELGRLDTDGSELATAFVAGTDTAALVVSTDGPRWTTDAADVSASVPMDVRCSGARLRVVDVSSSIVDGYGRTVAPGGWGTPDSSFLGGSYSVEGTASHYSVTAGVGRITTTTINQLYIAHVDTGAHDGEMRASVAVPVVPTGAPITLRVAGRLTDAANHYEAQLQIATSGAATLSIAKRVADIRTTLATLALSETHSAGNTWRLRLLWQGSTLQARAWKSSSMEPNWQLHASDTSLTTGTRVGLLVRRDTGNTNGAVNIDWDDLEVLNPQTFTVSTVVNGVHKTIPAGSPVSLWTPLRLGL